MVLPILIRVALLQRKRVGRVCVGEGGVGGVGQGVAGGKGLAGGMQQECKIGGVLQECKEDRWNLNHGGD